MDTNIQPIPATAPSSIDTVLLTRLAKALRFAENCFSLINMIEEVSYSLTSKVTTDSGKSVYLPNASLRQLALDLAESYINELESNGIQLSEEMKNEVAKHFPLR
jgi:hypothetical protein